MKEWLELVALERDPWRSRFAALVPAATRAAIANALPTDWLPAALHVELADVLEEAFGPARAFDYYRRTMLSALRGPVFGPMFRTGLRLLGASPASLLRWAPKGWHLAFRDCGEVRGDVRGDNHGRLIVAALPSFCTASDPWLDSMPGSVYGALDLIDARGVVRLDKRRRAEGEIVLELEW